MAWDNTWDKIFRERPWGKYPGEDLIRFVARNFYAAEDRQAVQLLEIGCGPGANLWYMAREGFTVHGLEGSEHAVELARKRLDDECPGWRGEVRTGDIIASPYADAAFDAVIDSAAVTCNTWDTSKMIYREAARVLKPGGKLFSRTFAAGCWGDGTGARLDHWTWVVTEGPMQGTGPTRFTRADDIDELLGPDFVVDSLELLTRTMGNQAHEVREFIILATRRDS